MPAKVIILAEHDRGTLKDITFELLGMANGIADAQAIALLL